MFRVVKVSAVTLAVAGAFAFPASAETLFGSLAATYHDNPTLNAARAEQRANDERVLQEVAVFATRIDVAEELNRLTTHLDEVERVLKQGGACGKRLDFLMQELHREANTLGSKSVDAELSQASLELKVLIEQMREQVQNIE